MGKKGVLLALSGVASLCASLALQAGETKKVEYPKTTQVKVEDTVHGKMIVDNYQWLENAKDPKVAEWTDAQEKLTHSLIDPLPQKQWLKGRFEKLWRYDDESTPQRVLKGERLFFSTKKKMDEHWVYCTKEREGAPTVELIDPNKWGPKDTLDLTVPSRDGRLVAFGRAQGGDENPVIQIMEVATKNILPDKVRGWKQEGVEWLPDGSGFYYVANPLKGEVPEGEEYYWSTVWLHKLGTPADQDVKIFSDSKVKELFHYVSISEDGKYEFLYKSRFNESEVYFRTVGSHVAPTPIATGFDAQYSAEEFEGKLFITTDSKAPKGRVFVTDVERPGRESWKEFIPETKDNLQGLSFIAGKLYAHYSHNAYILVKIYSLDGKYIRDLQFPTIGMGGVSGHWSQPETWVHFSSFTYPTTVFKYDFEKDELKLYHKLPIDVDVSNYTAEQVWYTSKDGTKVSMFLVTRKDLKKDGNNPVFLTGYGGFNVPITPRFSTGFVTWLEAGGMVAIPNLRGGGEYGREWHEAGWKEKKQNVFDDFIAAAQWLIDNKYTSKERLGIEGGSNGGLLVGAVAVQRPDLFRAVLCEVPLLDMVRYHKFGLANIWAEEYGSSEDPKQFEYLYKYSPYHGIKDGTKYPAMLIVGSENDARVDPLHARKMVARLQEADRGGGPILLLVQKASGHGGGTTITTLIEQTAEVRAFLMAQLGMNAPK